jgi:membrane protein YqaA with SNARE-associated domain
MGHPIPSEREAWEQRQVEAMRRRMKFWREVRRVALVAIILTGLPFVGVCAVAIAFNILAGK